MAEIMPVQKYSLSAASIGWIAAIILYFYTPTKTVTSHNQFLTPILNTPHTTRQTPPESVCVGRLVRTHRSLGAGVVI
jgi:hypothetical protein